jgi:hypothetical protein
MQDYALAALAARQAGSDQRLKWLADDMRAEQAQQARGKPQWVAGYRQACSDCAEMVDAIAAAPQQKAGE